MRLILENQGTLTVDTSPAMPEPSPDTVVLKVLYCAVCRADAKMWQQGHRDLLLPRVMGHEIAGVDETTGKLYTVWPGQACGDCEYCLCERENLCEEMKVIGFHSDGGFARYVEVPKKSLIFLPDGLKPELATFAEPVGCVINALKKFQIRSGQRSIIYGGGVMGMLAALILKEKGYSVTVVEQRDEKRVEFKEVAGKNDIILCNDTIDTNFDLAVNCCASPVAFGRCIENLRKGGQLAYFSGLNKDEKIDTNLLNLIHYKELVVIGSYGPKMSDMVEALSFCNVHQSALSLFVERVVGLSEVESLFPSILRGERRKCIVDMSLATFEE